MPVAERSLRPSWASLARCCLRSAIHGCADQSACRGSVPEQRPLPGTGSLSLFPP